MQYLDKTAKALYKHTVKKYREGKIRPHLGMRGHLVLMLDKLDRILSNELEADIEIKDLASDALVAFWLYTCARIQEQIAAAEVEEDEDEESGR